MRRVVPPAIYDGEAVGQGSLIVEGAPFFSGLADSQVVRKCDFSRPAELTGPLFIPLSHFAQPSVRCCSRSQEALLTATGEYFRGKSLSMRTGTNPLSLQHFCT